MAIKAKPKATPVAKEPVTPDDTEFTAYLNKGGTVAGQTAETAPEAPKKDIKFTLVIPAELCAQLDGLRAAELVKTSRHKWVLEAILQRVQQETAD